MAKEKTDLEKAIEIIKKNPELAKLLITPPEETQEKVPETHSSVFEILNTKPQKPKPKQIFFDDPSIGVEEGKWDKKHSKKFKRVAERRPPASKFSVKCSNCGEEDEISEELHKARAGDSYFCSKCCYGRIK